jgi:hypothetical protein
MVKQKNNLIVLIKKSAASWLVVFALFVPVLASAQSAPTPTYFGGRLIAYVPMIISPAGIPLCPAHIVVQNVTAGPPQLGLYFTGIGIFQYLYGTLFNGASFLFIPTTLPPGVSMLGKYEPVPYVTCPVPYPVFPMSQILETYFFGTALEPL